MLLGATTIVAAALTSACAGAPGTPTPVATASAPLPATTPIPTTIAPPSATTGAPSTATLALVAGTPVEASFFAPLPTPAGTPTTPLLVFAGASNVYGAKVQRNETFPAQTLALLAPARYDAVNYGVNGNTIANVNMRATEWIDPLYAASRSKNIVVVYVGPNDLNGGASVDEVYAALVAFGQVRRRVGFKVVMLTFLPWRKDTWGAGADYETERQSINARLRENHVGFIDALADVAADPLIGPADAPTNLAYYHSDGVHLVAAGYRIMAEIVKAAILTI